MAIDFPASPTLNQTYTFGSRTWIFNSTGWELQGSGSIVQSFSGGTTGLTPSTATTGAVTLAGTLAVANGGTGVVTSTGSGSNVLSASPTLVTPLLGTPTSGDLANCTGYTFANVASKPTTLSGYGITDGVSLSADNAFTGANTFVNTTGQTIRSAATQDGIILQGRAGGTTTRAVTLIPATLSASQTLTLPNVSGTVVTTGDTGTVTNTMLAGSITDAKLSTISTAGKVSGSAITSGTIGGSTIVNTSGTITSTSQLTASRFETSGGGTASAPALQFTASEATGLFRSGLSVIGFSTSGTEGARLSNQQLSVGDNNGTGTYSGNFVTIGDLGIEAQATSAVVGVFRRNTTDGTIISFRQDATEEGQISVSGTTVSYTGGHLTRWSQILGVDAFDASDRPLIYRGTVMSNVSEMCEWPDPESDEIQANEQLNKTVVSSIPYDKAVAGVFQGWDNDDETWKNDYYLAMTGDFVIRIAATCQVAVGDLLVSAGDGTAMPQQDDILRSSTIAKVTSDHVSSQHPDGSYCVPCVLMAC